MSGREVREYTNLTDPKDKKYGKGKEKIDEEDITFQRMVAKSLQSYLCRIDEVCRMDEVYVAGNGRAMEIITVAFKDGIKDPHELSNLPAHGRFVSD